MRTLIVLETAQEVAQYLLDNRDTEVAGLDAMLLNINKSVIDRNGTQVAKISPLITTSDIIKRLVVEARKRARAQQSPHKVVEQTSVGWDPCRPPGCKCCEK